MLSHIPQTEQAPPLYYVLAWLWTRPFGTSEVGVRTLSALLGTAAIPLAFALGRQLVSQRAGLVAAALTAFSPLLVWYSQEARSYALLVPMSGLTILLFQRAVDERGGTPSARAPSGTGRPPRRSRWPATTSALFLVVRRRLGWCSAGTAAARRQACGGRGRRGGRGTAAAGAAPGQPRRREVHQRIALGTRVAQVPKQYLVGYASPAEVPLAIGAALVAALALWLALTRTDAVERRGARIAGAPGRGRGRPAAPVRRGR